MTCPRPAPDRQGGKRLVQEEGPPEGRVGDRVRPDAAGVPIAAGRRKVGSRPVPGPALLGLLQGIAADESRERLSFGDLMVAMGERAFGPLLFLFALPNILPTPPGTSGVMAVPLIFLTVQMVMNRKPWLPGFVTRRTMSRATFAGFVTRATPWLVRAGRFLRPRMALFVQPWSERLVGAACLLLALVLLLPIPFANSTPALAICFFALGLLERDGAWIIAGLVSTVWAIVLAGMLGFAFFQGALLFLGHLVR